MPGTKIFCLRQSARTQTGCISAFFLLWQELMLIRGRRQPDWRLCRRRSRRRHCFDPRFGLGQKLEIAGSRDCCCAAGSIAASIGRVWRDHRNRNHGCRARNCKGRHSTEKLLVAVGGHRVGAIVDDATRSGSDIKRTDHRVGLRRNIPVREQHRSAGSGQSISIVVRCASVMRTATPPCQLVRKSCQN